MYLSSDSATLNTHNLILGDTEPALATQSCSDSCYCPGAALVSQLQPDILTQPFTVI